MKSSSSNSCPSVPLASALPPVRMKPRQRRALRFSPGPQLGPVPARRQRDAHRPAKHWPARHPAARSAWPPPLPDLPIPLHREFRDQRSGSWHPLARASTLLSNRLICQPSSDLPMTGTADDFIFPSAISSMPATAYFVAQRSISDRTSSTRHAVIRAPIPAGTCLESGSARTGRWLRRRPRFAGHGNRPGPTWPRRPGADRPTDRSAGAWSGTGPTDSPPLSACSRSSASLTVFVWMAGPRLPVAVSATPHWLRPWCRTCRSGARRRPAPARATACPAS